MGGRINDWIAFNLPTVSHQELRYFPKRNYKENIMIFEYCYKLHIILNNDFKCYQMNNNNIKSKDGKPKLKIFVQE